MELLQNIGTLLQCKTEGAQDDIHPIENAALVWDEGTIRWVGAQSEVPKEYQSATTYEAQGKLVVPGLIDCHTHLAFGGERSREFEMRVLGKSYLEIAKAGGGILSTVDATRALSEEELLERCETFLAEMVALGVTTVECKSGYGLTLEDELKLLRVYQSLAKKHPVSIVSTFLGAHTVPSEYKDDREKYIDMVVNEMLPAVAEEGLAQFCDIFVEDSAFSVDEARVIFEAGKQLGLRPKLHADQLSDGGGAALAAEVGAISADHLECISDDGITKLKEAGVIGVTLPLASLYTHQPPLNARRLIDGGVRVAVATDFNPGSAPSYHLPLAMMLATNMNRMTPAEVLKGVTSYAAQAIGVEGDFGSIEVGKKADFAVINAPSINYWLYQFRPNACVATVKDGNVLHGAL